jgi:hypothetical protein
VSALIVETVLFQQFLMALVQSLIDVVCAGTTELPVCVQDFFLFGESL